MGFNTPAIIKYPFERMTFQSKNTSLIRINKDCSFCNERIKDKTALFNEDAKKILNDLKKLKNINKNVKIYVIFGEFT